MRAHEVRAGISGPHHPDRSVRDYDVVVVGGRVAGASTALLLARHGHRVLVIERASMPSDTVSTHAVLRTGILQLTRWGLLDELIAAGTPPIQAITLGFGADRIDFRVRPDFEIDTLYAPRRYLLDHILATAAQAAGVEYLDETSVTGLTRSNDDRVTGVEIGRGDDRTRITAKMVIGADGHNSRVASLVESRKYRSHRATNAISYAYFDGVEHNGFWFQFTPGVNVGLIPTNDDQCLAFAGRPSHLRQRFTDDPDGEFRRLLSQGDGEMAQLVSDATRVSRFHATTGLEGFFREAWGDGWVLVGDAGYTEDPISAHGISDALRDAELCARAVDRALSDPADAPVALDWFQTLRDSLSLRTYQEAQGLARFDWDEAEASARMRVISDEVRSECETLVALPDWDESAVPART